MRQKTFKRTLTFLLFCLNYVFLSTAAFADSYSGDAVGKTTSMSLIYGVLAGVALLLLGCYCILIKKKQLLLILLFTAVFVVDLGYFALSVSRTLEEALLANRIAYMGSVFLPLCMLIIILDACKIRPKKSFIAALIAASAAIFLLAASGGYLKLYYAEVSIVYINGVARLQKVYGPLHFLYLVYLALYFSGMVAAIVYAMIRRKITHPGHAVILAAVVLGNIGIWLVEQLIYLDFEILSISYIISELFLLLLSWMLQAQELPAPVSPEEAPQNNEPADLFEKLRAVCPEADSLTGREAEVLHYILENRKRREIAEIMCVSENTIKKHTSHIFSKLGVASRGELFVLVASDSKND